VSDIVASSTAEVAFPLNYTLTISSTTTGCETTANVFIESVFCNIQKESLQTETAQMIILI
jgi:hypothetical protein